MFRVESKLRTQGGAVVTGSLKGYEESRVVRFRHVTTGRYLCVDYNDSGLREAQLANTGGSKQLQAVPGKHDKLHRSLRGGNLFGVKLVDEDELTDERRVRRTHFCLIPVVRNDDSQDETVRIGGSAMRCCTTATVVAMATTQALKEGPKPRPT